MKKTDAIRAVVILTMTILLLVVVDPLLLYIELAGLPVVPAVELWSYTMSVVATVLIVKYLMEESKE